MPGIFNPRNRPKRPGAYFNWIASEQPVVLPSATGVVAVAFTNNWGPLNQVVALNSWADYLAIFGDTATTEGYAAVKGAFQGEGVPGRGGAGGVLALRYGAASAAKATLTINNTGATPALRLDARYFGDRGNSLRASTLPLANGVRTLVVYDGTTELDRFTYTDTDLASLATAINARSGWVTATVLVDGTALAAVTSTALAGGANGITALADGDHINAINLLAPQRFGFMAFAHTLSTAVQTSLATFVTTQNSRGRRFIAVVGGNLGETLATANTRSLAYNNSDVVNLGGADFMDSQLGALGTAQMAPRVAGILAQRGEVRSATFARLAGVTLTATGAIDDTTVETAFAAGTVVFTSDSHPTAPVRIEKALTSYTGGDGAKPVNIYSSPKKVHTLHAIETELTSWAELNVVGTLPVNDNTRAYVVGETQARLNARVDQGILQGGDNRPVVRASAASTDDVEFVELEYGVHFANSVEQVFNSVRIG